MPLADVFSSFCRALLDHGHLYGHSGAHNALGEMYNVGEGVDADKTAAVFWWRRAALQGEERAWRNLVARGHESAQTPWVRCSAMRLP